MEGRLLLCKVCWLWDEMARCKADGLLFCLWR